MEEYIEGASVENKRKNQSEDAGLQLQYRVSFSAECRIRFDLARPNAN
jgi:hypothetical protein